jgi:hypothetical protein
MFQALGGLLGQAATGIGGLAGKMGMDKFSGFMDNAGSFLSGGGGGAGGGGGVLGTGLDFSQMSPDQIKKVQSELGVTVDGIVGPETQGAYDKWSSGQPSQDTAQGADNAAQQAMNEAKKESKGSPLTDAFNNMDFGHYSSYK